VPGVRWWKHTPDLYRWLFYQLLFISYQSVKRFLKITVLFFIISSWNLHDMCQRFFMNQKRNFNGIWPKKRNFPIDPHCKNRSLWQRHVHRHDVAKVSEFYNGCLWGFFFFNFYWTQLKFHFWVHKNLWHISCKFQLEIAKNKQVIAKKSFTNSYEMISRIPIDIRHL